MRRISFLAVLAATATLLSWTTPSSAKDDWVCWMTPSGVTDCAWVKERYRVRDIAWKPHRHKTAKQPCKHCFVDFRLSNGQIDDLGRRVDTSSMRRFHDATLYGEKYRGPYNHD